MENEYANYPWVVVEPGRVGGKPTVGGSRVPAELVADCLDHGESAEDIAYNYTLPIELIVDFKAFRDEHHAMKSHPAALKA